MVFGLARASLAAVSWSKGKVGFGSAAIFILVLSLPVWAEDSAANAKGSAISSSSRLETVSATSRLSAENSSPVLLPVTPDPVQPTQVVITRPPKGAVSQSQVTAWRALVIAQHSAALFDAWSTRQALSSGNGYERDPLMKPFANSATIYPATQAAPLLFDFLGHRMMRSQNRFLRRTWWLPQAASFAGSVWCGSRNLHVANLKH